jgi:protein ImuB
MKRIASICLPALAIERWNRFAESPDAPVALVVEAAHGQLIHAVTPAAAERGAHPGMRLTDARALDPGLRAEVADPVGDAALLKRLGRWAGRWSPLVEVDGEDGLRLDVSGIAHLFGGEQTLVADMRSRFAALGLKARVAIAPTAGAAWALSRFKANPPIVMPAKAGIHAQECTGKEEISPAGGRGPQPSLG